MKTNEIATDLVPDALTCASCGLQFGVGTVGRYSPGPPDPQLHYCSPDCAFDGGWFPDPSDEQMGLRPTYVH